MRILKMQRNDLDTLFRQTAPEAVLKTIRSGRSLLESSQAYKISADDYPGEAYDHFSLLNLQNYSPTEVELRGEALSESMARIENGGVFSTLVLYADQVLHYNGNHLICKLEHSLDWQSVYLRLGQDIFTTAWLAWRSRNDGEDKVRSQSFTWPAILKTDDKRLNALLEKGTAENHFHLNGSTQSFSLSWACLMNHPNAVHGLLQEGSHFKTNLDYRVSSGEHDNVMNLESRVLYAAMIRALLFEKRLGILGGDGHEQDLEDIFMSFDNMPLPGQVESHTEMLRYLYGEKFRQLNGRRICLDYANCSHFYGVDERHDNRLLAGERSFLYRCFRMKFRGELSRLESDLFYLYLLLKNSLRSELIQVNNRFGFQNFLNYQNRKDQLFEKYDEYRTEALRLSVCSGIRENHIISLEARIMPKKTCSQMRERVRDLDKRVELSQRVEFSQREKLPYFYVVHFAKFPFTKKEFDHKRLHLRPRNYQVRNDIKQQAKALRRYMQYNGVERRIRGVDACSMEIGCRPETFATEIRYLRETSRESRKREWYWEQDNEPEEIGVTYHVGEDFLDIADGLRALDETLRFLCLEKGNRIGHALALGIDPDEYYQIKKHNVYLRKQDYLDNLVWLLYRSLELGVEIGENNRAAMTARATELLYHIFFQERNFPGGTDLLNAYYRSWQLRGDHPDLYKSGKFEIKSSLAEEDYDNFMIAGGLRRYKANPDPLDVYRYNTRIAKLCYLYHFDTDVKKRGYETDRMDVEKWYINAMRDMQQAMRMEVFKKGICIECNPTSNVLIGTFKSYRKHPLLTFNTHCLQENDTNPNLRVSINTDDLGVFDTSLENEYAVMFDALSRSRHEAGNYNDDAIYEYLDYLRQSGIDMAFSWDNTQKEIQKLKKFSFKG